MVYQSGGKFCKNDRFAATAHPARTSLSRRKAVCVDLKADKPLKTPVTMAAIKADKRLADMALVKYSRLSVRPVTAEEWKIVCKMGGV
jgi:predicted RNA-binding protein with PUA-like domain